MAHRLAGYELLVGREAADAGNGAAVLPGRAERGDVFFFSSRRRHTRSVSAFLLNRSSDLACRPIMSIDVVEVVIWRESSVSGGSGAVQMFLRWQQRKP